MVKRNKHIRKFAHARSLSFLQPAKVVRFSIAFLLIVSLFPAFPLAAFAAGSSTTTNQAFTTDAATAKASTSQTTTATTTTNNTTASALTQGSTNTSVIVQNDGIALGVEPLNLIQNGNYKPTASSALAQSYAGVAGVSAPTAEQHKKMKARLNTALMNVSTSTYSGQSDWCIISVLDLQAPIASNATSYAKELVEEVINENPDLFYAGASYGAGTTTVGSKVILRQILVRYYYKPSTIASMKTKYENAMENVLSWVNATKSYKGSTDAEKAKAVHDWLVRNAKYNYSAYLKGSPSSYGSNDPWTAYGAIVTKSPVCEGYSLAFIAAMNRLGIQASFVTNAGHGWNRVRLKVGSSYYWYNLDITWDDPVKSNNHYADGGYSTTPSTSYFLKSDTYFKTKLGEKAGTGQHAKWTPAGTAGTNTTFDGTWAGGVYPLSSNTHTVSSLVVSPTTLTLNYDDTATLTLKATGTNVVTGMAKWTSSNPSIAAVSGNGMVTSGSKSGNATITVTLGGKTAKCTVTVSNKPQLSNAKVSLASTVTANDLKYVSGVARKPAIKVVMNGTTLTQGTDYTISWPSDTINPGTKTATITGKGKYSGTTTFTYTITHSISSTGITKTGNGYKNGTITTTYNGSAQKKVPVLTFKGSLGKTITLKEGTDFTVSWSGGAVNAGTYTATVRGRGAWTGSFTYKLKINAVKMSSTSISYDATKRYTGKAITQSPTVKVGSTTLPSSSYSISYRNNVNAGTATMTISGKGNLTGSVVKQFKIVKNATWTRLSGYYAFDTMAAITKRYGTTKTAIVASNADFKDTLAAIGLAGSLGAVALTTEKNSLVSQTRSELLRMGVKQIFVIGNTSDVSNNVLNQIRQLSTKPSVVRISGSGATGKSIAAAKKQTTRSNTVIIATQNSFKDALSISPYAYTTHSPIIYAESNKKLSSAAISYIKSAKFSQAIIVGGPGALPKDVETQLRSAGISAGKITRLAGFNCYETSRVIGEWALGTLKNGTGGGSGFYRYASIKFQPSVKMGINNVGISRGDNWKDALAGAALCGKNAAILLLADKSNTSNAETVIKKYKTAITQGYVFGGTGAVSQSAMNKCANASK